MNILTANMMNVTVRYCLDDNSHWTDEAAVWPSTRFNYAQNWILVHVLLIVLPFSMYALEVLKWNSSHCIPYTMLVSMHQEILLQY